MKKILSGCLMGAQVFALMASMAPLTIAAAPSRFLIVYTVTRGTIDKVTPEEQPKFQEHFAYMKRHFEKGQLIWGGRVLDPQHPQGLVLIEAASEADARGYASGDPAVKAGVLKATVEPFEEVFHAGCAAPAAVTSH